MKQLIAYILFGLVLSCLATARTAPLSFTDEEIQKDIDEGNWTGVRGKQIINFCWREKKIEFLKQYMAKADIGVRSHLIQQVVADHDRGVADEKVIIPLLLHALKTDGIWQRVLIEKPIHQQYLGYTELFVHCVKRHFPEIKLMDVSDPEQRKYAIKHIEGARNAAIQQKNKNRPSVIRTPRRLEDDLTENQSSTAHSKNGADQSERKDRRTSFPQWIYLVLATVLAGGIFLYLRRKA